jgi:hypothetical protein
MRKPGLPPRRDIAELLSRAGTCALFANLLLWSPAIGQEAGCSREAFEAAVGQSAAALRDLTSQNRPLFQARLRDLKEKRGWTHDQFLREAAPIVQDERAAAYDKESNQLLEDIQRMGVEGSAEPTPDCAALALLKGRMEQLVTVQRTKWTYLIEKVDRELAR